MTVVHTGIADYLSNTQVAAAWNARHCNIISVMRKWYEFEKTPGVYSFGSLKTAGDGIQFAHDHDILLFIRFMAGADAPVGRPGVATSTHPDWLNLAPYNVPRFRTLDNDAGTPDRNLWIPYLWNATYRARYLLAIDAWNTWFESPCPRDSSHNVSQHISGLSISAITENGAEQNVSPGQRHKYTNGTMTWPVGYGADYNDPQNLAPGTLPATGSITGLPSTSAFTVPGLFKIADQNSIAYAATDELVYATGKTATSLTGVTRGFSGTTAQTHTGGTAEVQLVTLGSFDVNGDSFTLTAEGNTTSAFVRGTNATASAIQAALRTATGNTALTVTGTSNVGPFTVTFVGESGNQVQMTGTGTGCSVTVTTPTQGTVDQVIRQADASNTTAVHLATVSGVTGLYDHSRYNAQQWFNADGLTYAGRIAQLASLWHESIIDVIAHLTTVRPGWAGGALWGDALASATAQLEELGPVYREGLHVITTNLSAKPPRTSASDPIPTYENSFNSYFTWLKRAQQLGCSTSIQTQGVSSTGAQNGQQIIDACETGLVEFGGQLEYIETNGNSRFAQTNGGAGWDTWAAYGWPGGHINDMEDYFVSDNGAFPQALQGRILGSQLGIGAANLSGTGSASVVGRRTRKGAAALTGTGTSAIQGVRRRTGSATLTGVGSSSFSGKKNPTGRATLFGAGSSTSAGKPTQKGTASLTGTGSGTAAGTHQGRGAATLVGMSSMAAAWGTSSQTGQATLTGTGGASGVGRRDRKTGATFSGTGGGSFAGSRIAAGIAIVDDPLVDVDDTLVTVDGGRLLSDVSLGQATISGSSGLTATGTITKEGAAVLAGTGAATVGAAALITAAATLSGTGLLTVGFPIQGEAILVGISTERVEGAIADRFWPQRYTEEWEDALV